MNEFSVTLRHGPETKLSRVAQTIKPSGIRRFFDIVSQMRDVISLGVGEPDLAVPIDVKMAGVTALMEGNTRYTSNAGAIQLREAIAGYLQKRLDVHYDPADEVLVTVGVSQAIDLALRAILDPGDEVLIPEPCFVSYIPCTQLAGGCAVPVPLSATDGFRLTAKALEQAITPRTKAILMSFPSNPTGATLTTPELAEIARVAVAHDLIVISDEIYSELTYTDSHVSIAEMPDMRDRTILLNGFSKTFSMTGWRLGYAAGPKPLIQAMCRIHQQTLMCAPTVAQVAGITALSLVDQVVPQVRETYNLRRTLMYQGLTSMGLPCAEPLGAFYIFPSVARTGMTDEEFAELLLQEEHVAAVPGSAFGEAGRGFIRCSYATATDKLEVALERMARFVVRHRSV